MQLSPKKGCDNKNIKIFVLLSDGSQAQKWSWCRLKEMVSLSIILRDSQKSLHLLNSRIQLQSYCIQEKSYITVVLWFKQWIFFRFLLNFRIFLGLIQYFCFRNSNIIRSATSGDGWLGWNGCWIAEEGLSQHLLITERKYCSLITNLNNLINRQALKSDLPVHESI